MLLFLNFLILWAFACHVVAVLAAAPPPARVVVLNDGPRNQQRGTEQIADAVRNALVEARQRNYFENNNNKQQDRGGSWRAEPSSSFSLVLNAVYDVEKFSTVRLTELVCNEISAGAVAFIGPANPQQRRHVRALCDRVGIVFIELYMSSCAAAAAGDVDAERAYRSTQSVLDVAPPRSLYARAVADYALAAGWNDLHVMFDDDDDGEGADTMALRQLESLMDDSKLKITFYSTRDSQDENTDPRDRYLLTIRQLWRQYKSNVNEAIVVSVKNVTSFVNAVLQHQMHTRHFKYFFINLDSASLAALELPQMSAIGANISILALHYRPQLLLSSSSDGGGNGGGGDMTMVGSPHAALAYDAALLLAKSMAQLAHISGSEATMAPLVGAASWCTRLFEPGNQYESVAPAADAGAIDSVVWPHGDTLLNMLETAALDETGTTGALSLHRSGQSSELTRRLIDFNIFRVNRRGQLNLVSQWSGNHQADGISRWNPSNDRSRLLQNFDEDDDDDTPTATPAPPPKIFHQQQSGGGNGDDGVLRVAVRLVTPFVMRISKEEQIKFDRSARPRDRTAFATGGLGVMYQGYCVDLINALAEREKFEYRFVVAPDNQPGVPQQQPAAALDSTTANGSVVVSQQQVEWSGMIGMLLRGEADLAIADLSVTARRSAVVDFTEPFMTQGIGVLFQSPRPMSPHLFGLLKAYSPLVWVSIVVALVVVSHLLRILGRLSPYEWTNAHECTGAPDDECDNNFNYRNSLWFCAITFMLQGCDLNPRAPSTRLLAASWWIFALVLWISYVANLAAFLTVDTMSTPIRSVDDLVKHPDIRYGIVRNSSQEEFFRASKVPTFRQMWNVMSAAGGASLLKSDNEGLQRVKEGGYAHLTDTSRIRYWANRNCSLAQVGAPINVDYFAIALPEGSRLVETLSRGILAMKTKSLAQFEDKWWKSAGTAKCSEQGGTSETSGPQPLTAKVVGGIFVIGLCGLLGAFVVAICEFVWQARKNVREHGAKASIFKEMLRELFFAVLVHRPPRRAPRHAATEAAAASKAIVQIN